MNIFSTIIGNLESFAGKVEVFVTKLRHEAPTGAQIAEAT